jgi:PAS domain S-box-containing protein
MGHDTVRAIAELVEQVIWAMTPEGELMDDSPTWRALTGQSWEESRGHGWLDAVHPEDREHVEHAWRAAREHPGPYEIECRIRRPNLRYTRACMRGRPVFDPEGRVREWLATAREVWADESVRRSEERLRLATEAAQVAVWEYDFIAGQMTRTENHDGLYGLPPQHVWQYDIFTNATHPDDRELSNRIVQASIAPGGPDDYAFDFRVIWPDGSIHWLAVSGHVFARDASGRATLVRGALIDVTRLKRVEAELREAIRVQDEFLQIASHELNTPLTPLALKLSLLQQLAARGPCSPEVLSKHLETAQRQVRRLSELVKDLLDVTRLSRGQMQLSLSEVSLPEVVSAVVEQFSAEAQRNGCTIELALMREAVGHWDRGRIEQVVENLLGNAIKYGSGKPIQVEVTADPERARLVVRDQGIGIEAEALPRIFNKFERASSARHFGGLGLGLFIVRQITENHGGTIRASSEPQRGSTFVVELPLRR